MILGVISAGHHHRLSAPEQASHAAAAPAASEVLAASDCVVCRAADPVRVVLTDVAVPDVVITSAVTPALTEPTHAQPFPRCSPRAPPVAA